MPEDFAKQQQDTEARMQKLFHDFYHAGISEPLTGFAFNNYAQQAVQAGNAAAAGGKYEHED